MPSKKPIFADPSQRRWRSIRRVLFYVSGAASLLLIVFVFSILLNPFLGNPRLRVQAHLPQKLHLAPIPLSHYTTAKERYFQRARARLFASRRPLIAHPSGNTTTGLPRYHTAAFYVTWDDASLTSLRQNAGTIDVLYPQWIKLVDGKGSLQSMMDEPGRDFVRAHDQLMVVPMVTNFDFKHETWFGREAGKSLRQPEARDKMVWTLLEFVQREHFRGVLVDFEQVPPSAHPAYVQFIVDLAKTFHHAGLQVDVALPFNDPADIDYRHLASLVDHVCLMAYDEHADGSVAGPLCSINWFSEGLRARAAEIPPEKLIISLGNYGYDWLKNTRHAKALTFQESVVLARDAESEMDFEDQSLNCVFRYEDDDNREHTVWYQDAATFYNELLMSLPYNPAAIALWRLGSEDPGVWDVLTASDPAALNPKLSSMRYGYDLDYEGKGEILKVENVPVDGRRTIEWDKTSPLITDEIIHSYPSPYTLYRYGHQPKWVALTFDDGPDPRYTPVILDILKKYGVKATFFVIGINAESERQLLQREYDEGHEIGNHTFTHPNIGEVPARQIELELTTTQRLLESILSRKTILFRPPYNVDAEPAFPREAFPVAIASRLGYVTIGSKIDPADYLQPGVATIVKRTVQQLPLGNVILLHDSGGRREQTVACLPALIQAVRRQGYEFVPMSALLGKNRDALMPTLDLRERYLVIVNSITFLTIEGGVFLLRWAMMVGVFFGLIRFSAYAVMALIQRWRRRDYPASAPPVDIIIPAYNEEKVIVSTIQSLLRSRGVPVRILVVDDGSTDRTSGVVRAAFRDEPRVQVIDRANEGKWAALNYGLSLAQADIIVTLDADTIFDPFCIAELVKPFADPKIAAVAGNAKVGNRNNILTRWQALEYITAQNLDRRANELLNCITVVPGAVGAWRRFVLEEVGGFHSDTLAEDAELTIRILRHDHRIAYADRAIAWTEAPETTRNLFRQRFRWMYGTLQAAWKHRDLSFAQDGGTLGWIAIPNLFLFQVIFPYIAPLIDLTMISSALFCFMNMTFHPSDYNAADFQNSLFYYCLFLGLDALASAVAFMLEPGGEDWTLLFWLPWQRFYYRQLMYVIAIRSTMAAVRGQVVAWGHITRNARHIQMMSRMTEGDIPPVETPDVA